MMILYVDTGIPCSLVLLHIYMDDMVSEELSYPYIRRIAIHPYRTGVSQ